MKKIYILSALALTFVFGSCTMEKRHHRNGYFISWNHQTPKAIEKSTPALVEQAPVTQNVEVEETKVAATTEVTPNIVDVFTPATTIVPVQSVAPATNITEKSENTIAPSKSVIKQAVRSQRNADNQSAPETDKVLLIILCFLLPPLAMYLYEGSWTSRCTVNLILTLLCGLPGVIHALIVILGGK